MRTRDDMMRLGAFLTATGQHPGAWRHPNVAANGGVSLAHYRQAVAIAERGLFDLMFLADNAGLWDRDIGTRGRSARVSYFEPVTLLSALASITERIGLVATMTTTFNEPFNVARKYASLDHLSGGRAGWNLVTSANQAEALNFGYDEHLLHGERYERAQEFADVVLGLWESWDDDAFVFDKENGLFNRPEGLHFLNHFGKYYKVRGPLNIGRTPQGRPIVVQAGSSEPGIDLAARTAELVFTAQHSKSDAQAFYAKLQAALPRYGRGPANVRIMPGISPVVAETEREAQAKYDALQALIDPSVGLGLLSSMTGGMDLSKFPLDGPLPPLPETTNAAKGRQALLKGIAEREQLTIRQLYLRIAGARGHHIVVGTPVQIADRLEEWFTEGAADGFNIMPQALPDSLTDFVDLVIPELQRRGLFRRAYEGRTLREHLGLPWPHRGITPPRPL